MSGIDRDEHFHAPKIFTCPCFFEIVVFAKTVKIKCCIAIYNLIKRKKSVRHFAVSCQKNLLLSVMDHRAIQIGCIEMGVECSHYNKNTFMALKV